VSLNSRERKLRQGSRARPSMHLVAMVRGCEGPGSRGSRCRTGARAQARLLRMPRHDRAACATQRGIRGSVLFAVRDSESRRDEITLDEVERVGT
jgi:hypothetical protein